DAVIRLLTGAPPAMLAVTPSRDFTVNPLRISPLSLLNVTGPKLPFMIPSLSCVCVSRWVRSDQGRVDGREDDEHPEREAGERSEDLDCVFHDLTFPFSNV